MLSVSSRQSPLNLCLYTKHCCKSVCQDHNVLSQRGRCVCQMIGGPPASAYQCHSQYVIFMHFFPTDNIIIFSFSMFFCHTFLSLQVLHLGVLLQCGNTQSNLQNHTEFICSKILFLLSLQQCHMQNHSTYILLGPCCRKKIQIKVQTLNILTFISQHFGFHSIISELCFPQRELTAFVPSCESFLQHFTAPQWPDVYKCTC